MSPRRVLLVDDEEEIREVAGMSLGLVGGWQVETCACGADAIRLAAVAPPDVIVLDVMMPGLDGPATYSELQSDARTRSIPVIFLTAKAQPAEKRRLAELGVCGVIAKPFDPLTLASEVEALLRGH